MTRNAGLGYAGAGLALVVWAVVSRDYLPMGLLFLVGITALLHLTGPGRLGKGAEDHHAREQAKARYGVNAPDRPRF